MDYDERAAISSEIFAAFARIVHRTSTDANAILRADGLTPAQFQLLQSVSRSPGINQAHLAQLRGGTPGGMSQLIAKLEQQGLLRREAAGASNRLWVTDDGMQLIDRILPDQNAYFARRFARMDDPSIRELHRLATEALAQLPSQVSAEGGS